MKRMMISVMALLLCCCTLFGYFVQFSPAASAATYTDVSQVKGSDYTDRPLLAAALDDIFKGDAGIYINNKCTKLLRTPLGSRSVPNNGVHLYVGPYGTRAKNTGTSCWIYANGVYHKLFGEALGNGTAGKNSVKLGLSGTSNKKLTYANMCQWGVSDEVGAQIRVGNHSIIVLDYNATHLTYLDGNGDGKGRVAVNEKTWAQVSSSSNTNGTVKYIIQPKEEYLKEKYPSYMEQCVLYPVAVGMRATVTKKTTIKTLPCSAKTESSSENVITLNKGTSVYVYAMYKNSVGNYWYYVSMEKNGVSYVGYMFAGDGKRTQKGFVGSQVVYDSDNGYSLVRVR